MINEARTASEPAPAPTVRLKPLLKALGIAPSSWYHQPAKAPKRRGPPAKALDAGRKAVVVEFAERYPWWGYKRLAIVLRRAGHDIGKMFVHAVFREIVRRMHLGSLYTASHANVQDKNLLPLSQILELCH